MNEATALPLAGSTILCKQTCQWLKYTKSACALCHVERSVCFHMCVRYIGRSGGIVDCWGIQEDALGQSVICAGPLHSGHRGEGHSEQRKQHEQQFGGLTRHLMVLAQEVVSMMDGS